MKPYPTRVALSLCTHLTDTISLNDDTTWKAYTTLKSFNKGIRNVLTVKETDDKWVKEFNSTCLAVLCTLKMISSNISFSALSQQIALALELEVSKVFAKTSNVNNLSHLKEILKKEVPVIAAKEFLARNRHIQPRSMKCEDCGLGYFRGKKNSKGDLSLECQFCHHHQGSNLQLVVTHFVC